MNRFHSPASSGSGFRVTVAGDWAPVWTYEELMRRDPAAVYGDLLPLFRASEQDPAAGISRWHHYFFAPAHRHYFMAAFERMKPGTFGDAPEWARERVRRWKQ